MAGLDEAVAPSPVDAEANSEDAVLAQLETLLNDDGTTRKPPIKEESDEVDSDAEAETETDPGDGDEDSEEADAETDDEDAETDDDDDEEGDEDAEDSEDEESEIELSEEQLAEIFGLDEAGVKLSEEGDLKFRVKVDGEEDYVPLKDMVTSFQLEKHLRIKSQKDAEERKEFQAVKTAETERLNQTLTDATGLVSYLEQQLTSRYTPEQLNQLRATKPDEWAAVNQEIQNQGQNIAKIKANMQYVIQEQQRLAAEEARSRMATFVEEQTEKLYEHLPTWMDKDVAAAEYSAIQKAAIEAYGFTEEEMGQINDHRIIRVIRDAVKNSVPEAKSGDPLKKKLKKVPKIVKSGSTKTTKTAVNKKRAAAKRKRIQEEGGSVNSIASLIEDMI